ncbi:MAG: methionine--tRNA ligase [Candidatus Eisenbacteria bacterium]|nr:methionine--tRNA ligase [Candidatus Eisenbacteria bacterium]
MTGGALCPNLPGTSVFWEPIAAVRAVVSAANGVARLLFAAQWGGLLTTFKRTLVTSALPYANGRIHIGHLAGAYLPADIYVRYLRMRGQDVVFVCGSDEHGVPITLRALKEETTPRAIIDRFHEQNEAAFRAAGIEFDVYGRTSWPEHHALTQRFFLRLLEGGHIEKRKTQQYYSEKMQMFLPDRYVEGTCPKCSSGEARGDQCDACGTSYDVTELRDPRSAVPGDGSTPILRESMHWFLRLDHFQEALQEKLEGRSDWRRNTLGGAQSWLREGLRPRCVTRDTSWGVPIPLDDPDAAGKCIYVWFDAPIGYVTNTQAWAERQGDADLWKRYWQDPACRLVHFIGKDNIPFHAIIFPAMLMGQSDYILPDIVVANEYLNFLRAGEAAAAKFSKSRGTVIEVGQFVETYGADRLRYYLTAIAPETADSEFSWQDFLHRTNGEIADVFGNFVHRSLTFAVKSFAAALPSAGELQETDRAALAAIPVARDEVARLLERFQFRQAQAAMLELARTGNRYFDEQQPWVTRKSDLERCGTTLHVCLQLAAALARLAAPFLPASAARLAAMLGLEAHDAPGSWARIGETPLPPGTPLTKPQILFPKLEREEVPE